MELHEYGFNIKSRGETVELVGLGDIHYGTESCDKKKLIRMVDWIKNRKNCFWVGLGDFTENITYRDIRRFQPANIDRDYSIKDLADWTTRCTDDLTKILKPIANRCIGLGQGNHEFDALRNYDHDSTQRLCDNLGVKNLGWSCLTRLVFRRASNDQTKKQGLTLILLTEHSNVGGRQKGSKLNRLEARTSDFEFDIVLWGHSHDKVGSKKTRLCLPKKGKLQLQTHEMVYAIVPSFLRTYEVGTISYGERAGYSPTSLGIVLITIKPFAQEYIDGKYSETHHIHISQ